MPEDTPAPDEAPQEDPASGPDEAPATDESTETQTADPYEQRYNDLRAQYDRIHPRYSQYETFISNLTNPETQAEALRALGLEIEDDEEDEVSDDPTEALAERLDQFESYLTQQAQQAEQAEIKELEAEWLSKSLSEIEKSENVKLSDKERKAIENLGHSVRDEDGIPDYEAAFKLFSEASEASRERYLKSKDSAKVELGTAGQETVDLADDDARTQLLANMLEAGRD